MDLSGLFNLEFMMFAEMAVGYYLRKRNIIREQEKGVLTKMVVSILLPASIINSFNTKIEGDLLTQFAQILLISCGIQVLCNILASVLYRRTRERRRPILKYATVVSNAGFLGNAVAEGVYGSEGLLFGQFYLIPLRIVMWTAGLSFFAGKGKGKDAILNVITHPCIIAVFIGILRMVLNLPFPAAVDQTLASLGRCSTPLIMIFLGTILADVGFKTMFVQENIFFCVIRLLVIPALVTGILYVIGIRGLAASLSVILAAMPAASTTAVLAAQYDADVEFAADVVVLSTVLSILLLPAWVILLGMIF
ncbi:MAG: AEC family transporter [Solobacterium sp.]|nr:AEC family transporter [Solobacterium sp.]